MAIIGSRAFPRKIAAQRKNLEQRIEREGFAQVMEAVAYTWVNRFLALRYMEIHGYLEHGFRVLSNPSGSAIPEILKHGAGVEVIKPKALREIIKHEAKNIFKIY